MLLGALAHFVHYEAAVANFDKLSLSWYVWIWIAMSYYRDFGNYCNQRLLSGASAKDRCEEA